MPFAEVIMTNNKRSTLVRAVGVRARRQQGRLAAMLTRTPSAEKEAILAEMEFERWLAECCETAQRGL
ncbi:MAG TPA: hypothetical protein PK093_05515 [Phycisphaerae bacterium]|nr:hypothetical protein [Phycisphaerae bacterium]